MTLLNNFHIPVKMAIPATTASHGVVPLPLIGSSTKDPAGMPEILIRLRTSCGKNFPRYSCRSWGP